ncbi:hypothetical protein N7478_000659 [Penicillium angulare]|uniref:uncharacterized protein n=1 Tax=Penicillium angulare TaxID=116970 RepID=UPI002540D2B7|nr:uncharacterized protein N7478_000659 [Penicillium angulare]KAJ5291408.1 hypothetical protein N7478_000659 [Penicillium angulare]
MEAESKNDMLALTDIVRDIGRQQGENVYYRTCYRLLKYLQDSVVRAVEDLERITAPPLSCPEDFVAAQEVASSLRKLAQSLILQEQAALSALADLYSTHESHP